MGNNHKKKSLIPQTALTKPDDSKYISRKALELVDPDKNDNDSKVFVSLKFFQSHYQCFSEWSKIEMGEFWKFNYEIHEKNWQQVYLTARKNHKTGLAYTEIPIFKYPDSKFKHSLSKDITLFELRVNEKIRVHGFRDKSVFYLCWLDKNHSICT